MYRAVPILSEIALSCQAGEKGGAMSRFSCSLSFLLATVILLLSAHKSWLLLFWLAAILHELGHLLALYLLGGRVSRFCFRLSGGELQYDGKHLSYGGEVLLALAGPGINLLCAWLCGWGAAFGYSELLYQFSGCHLVLAFFNLLPALPLDGGRVLKSLLELRYPMEGERLASRVSLCIGAVLVFIGFVILLQGGNPTLFSAGGVILLRSVGKKPLHLLEKLLK